MMARQNNEEYQKYVDKRARELLRSDFTSLPGLDSGGDKSDPIHGPMSEALNRAYVQGWIDSEIDFVSVLHMLEIMSDDPASISELWDRAHKRPKSEAGIEYRRDWFEYEYAREQLKLAGIDPWGKRPSLPAPAAPPRAVTNKRAKNAKRK